MESIKKIFSILLCLAMLICVFAGCGNGGEESSNAQSGSSINQVGNVVGLGGATAGSKFSLISPSSEFYYSNTVEIEWNGLRDGETVTVKEKKKNGDKYTTVLEKKGLTGKTFKSNDKLEDGGVYRFTATAVDKNGKEIAKGKTLPSYYIAEQEDKLKTYIGTLQKGEYTIKIKAETPYGVQSAPVNKSIKI